MTLHLTRGYPASGKTTWAKAWVAEDEENRRRVNRDDIRHMLFGRYVNVDEQAVTVAQRAMVERFLRERKDVVIDDTNLKLRNLKNWIQIGRRDGHKVEIVDFGSISAETAILWDSNRGMAGGRTVGADVIRKMAKRYPQPWPDPDLPELEETQFRPVVSDGSLVPAMIVDLDGTFAIHDGRSPYDYSKVGTDLVNDPVELVMDQLHGQAVDEVIFLSGRPNSARRDTQNWLYRHGWGGHRLFMRKTGDDRADYVVKYEIFDREIRDNYDIKLVLDDRDQVVDMWRFINLPTWQVNRGDF